MKKIIFLAVLLLTATFVYSTDEFSVCFNYEGNGTYFLSSGGEYTSYVYVSDLGSDIEIITVLDSIAKPYLAFGEQDRDKDGVVEPGELRSDGIWIDYGINSYEWIVFGGRMDSEITVAGYPNVTYKPIVYSFTGPEPSLGEEVCISIHASPNGKCIIASDCKGIQIMSLFFDYTFNTGDVIKVEMWGQGKHKLKDVETGTVSSSAVNNSLILSDLVLDEVSTEGVNMTIYSVPEVDSKGNIKQKLDNELRFKVYQNDVLIGDSTKHTSCSEPIYVGEVFDGFTITALTKNYKNSQLDANNNGIADECECSPELCDNGIDDDCDGLIDDDDPDCSGPGEVDIPEFSAIDMVLLVLIIIFTLVLISYRKGNLLERHRHLKGLFDMFKKR
ncbi:hypothetical protein KY345_05520 [Candidatus Woesearchaeota archaeon]|nr:hypothetical protein [Candidatus Woesearchaeota archaeon]